MIGIYKITNPIVEIYIGKAINIEKRITQHKNNLSINYKLNEYNFNKTNVC